MGGLQPTALLIEGTILRLDLSWPVATSGPIPLTDTETGVFAPPSPYLKNVQCVRENEILVEQQPPRGVLVCDHAGFVINKLSF